MTGDVSRWYIRAWYNYSSKGELLVTKTGESSIYVEERDYNGVMDMAIVNNHYGVVSLLLSVDGRHGYDYDPHQHLATAAKLGRIQMVKALLAEVQERRNVALSSAAHNGDLARVLALIASGADDLNEALIWAMWANESDVVDFLVAFGGIDFNVGLSVAAACHNLKEVERFIKLGADNFDAALQEMARSAPSPTAAAYLLIERASDLNAALRSVLRSEDVGCRRHQGKLSAFGARADKSWCWRCRKRIRGTSRY